MDLNHQLPFKVGQTVESKSFQVGFRGAWFRCKITDISFRRKQIGCSLEYFDYPDEKIRWTQAYQKPLYRVHSLKKERKWLIFRPSFPFICRESDVPVIGPISDAIVIVPDVWKVGDLVDMWYDGCYWSGRVTQILGDDKFQVELPEPPVGEGKSYEALSKDLRPSLDWSPEHGWTVPLSRESEIGSSCIRLVRPPSEDDNSIGKYNAVEETTAFTLFPTDSSTSDKSSGLLLPSNDKERKQKDCLVEDSLANASFETPTPNSSNASCGPFLLPRRQLHPGNETSKQRLDSTEEMEVDVSYSSPLLPILHTTKKISEKISGGKDAGKQNPSFSFESSSSDEKMQDSFGIPSSNASRKDRYSCGILPKKRITGYGRLGSVVHADAIESSVMELEELANKIKWLKSLLKFGLKWSTAMKPSWKFFEAHGA